MRLRFLVLGASLLSSASAFYPSIEVAHCAHDISDFFNKKKIGIIIVDHGSKREEANHALVKLVRKYKSFSQEEIVEPAHMELAEPSISTAFKRCVEQGATSIICHPYFLSPGRHVVEDIPNLLKLAASEYPSVEYLLTEPLGSQIEIVNLIDNSITQAKDKIQSEPKHNE